MAKKEVKQSIAWHHLSASDVLADLGVSKNGLTSSEVRRRLEKYGSNELPQGKKKTVLHIFFSQFANPMMVVLVLAVGVSLFLQEWLDVLVIFAAIFINIVLGFVEEYKADRSLQALKEYLPQEVRVRRGGTVMTIESHRVVPGDILLLSLGDKITADARIVSLKSFEVNEAALTGESSPVKKEVRPVDVAVTTSDQVDMIFAGTTVVAGSAEAVVVRTGMNTEIGRIAQLAEDIEDEQTPLQKQLGKFARILGAAVAVLAAITFSVGLVHGFSVEEMFRISVALAVAAIPEGMIVGMTVILAIGMQRILKHDALVRRLVASETLGSVSVICFDKTGTLTTGDMRVDYVEDERDEVLLGLLHTNLSVTLTSEDGEEEFVGTPTAIAIAHYLQEKHVESPTECNRVSEIPFDSARKFAASYVACENTRTLYVLGAPEVVLSRCKLSKKERDSQQKVLDQAVEKGYRVLLLAKRDRVRFKGDLQDQDIDSLNPLSFIGLKDPLRDDARASIKKARRAGLHPVMVTGDHPKTALIIAQESRLVSKDYGMITGDELEQLSDTELKKRVKDIHVYARVLPKHKVRIVNAWQEYGATVAMTGDGVNDAPAIKAAEIGIAFGSGTAVAKEVADMVLLKNSFSTIVSAIREGRIIFDNIRKLVVYLLVDSFSEVILVLGALIFSLPLPILPAHILWINLITDGFPSIALTFEPGEKGIMNDPPRKKGQPILDMEMIILIFIVGIVTDILLFIVYFYLLGQNLPIEEIRTFMFVKLGLDSLIYVFAVRKFRSSAFVNNPFENPWLVVAVAGGVVLQILPLTVRPLRELFQFVPLLPIEWLAIFGLALLNLILIEIVKAIFNWRRRG